MKRQDLLDLNEALQHPGKTVAVDLSTELPEVEDVDLIAPVEGFLEATSTGNMLLIHGEFTTKCMCECARCGNPIEQDLKFEMDEEFPVEGVPSMFSTEDHARVVNDEGEPLFEENHLMVEALLRQNLLVNLPVQPLCAFGWEGPCPHAAHADKARAEEKKGPLAGLGQLIAPEDAS